MTVSSSTNRVSYNGNGSTTVFAYTFKIFDQDDLTVIIRSADGTETTKTITTHYTVSGVGNAGGGNVTMLTAPASGETITILREQDLVQGLDLVPNDPFPAQTVEDALDKLTFMVQQHEETLGRTIKASRTNTITGSEFTISAADRASKIFAFDSSGDVSITQEIGTYRGNWATSTAFAQRDLVKDTTNNNIYICLTAHTSTGSLPISSNTDSAKWALIVDAASATTSASAAASSATAAAASATAAAGSATDAETAQTAAETAQTAAETAQAATEAVYDNFDDRYLGAKASDPTLDNDGNALIDGALYFDTTNNVMKVYDLGTTTWLRTTPTTSDQANINAVTANATNINTVATNDANITTVAGISANVTTVAGISADVTAVAADATDIGTVSTNIANVNTVAGISANVTTVAGISADVTAVAADATDIGTVSTNITNVNTVAGISANVTTVAGISADVTTVAGISADVTTVAANVAGVNSFADRYRVGTSDPAVSLDTGDLFYNTTDSVLKVYNGTAWEAGVTAGSGFLAAANNLSDLTNTTTARTNLGVSIGTDVLAYDANLQTFVTAFTLPSSDGTSGQALTTNGSGTLSFSDAGISTGKAIAMAIVFG